MFKICSMAALLVGLVGCASMQNMMKSNFGKKAEAQGIAASDVEAVDRQTQVYYGDYQRTASQKVGVNDQMLQTQVNAQMTKITNIFCGCVKKLGDKCQANPTGLTSSEKELWVKGNGAGEALSIIQKSNVDGASCS